MSEELRRRERFLAALAERTHICAAELDYWPEKYCLALGEEQDFEGVVRLLRGPASDDSLQLWARGRADLTLEALVCEPAWRELFGQQEISEAEARLREWNAVDPKAVVAALAQDAAHPLYGSGEIDWGE
ncbi:MAG: hypothetical protein K6T61_02390 [Bryobacteraceae bacterium]|nr:hypothetical protein [Bryobacteraceae bacterium]